MKLLSLDAASMHLRSAMRKPCYTQHWMHCPLATHSTKSPSGPCRPGNLTQSVPQLLCEVLVALHGW